MDTTEFQGGTQSGRQQSSYYRSPREERPMALGPVHDVSAQKLARGLAWFSIGLGTAELLAPRAVAALCGIRVRRGLLVQLFGLREIASGALILSQGRRPALGVWSRVAGDAIDIATLLVSALLLPSNKTAAAMGAANVLAVTAADVACARELSRQQGLMTEEGALRVRRSITIGRRPEEVYEFWRKFENLPTFMYHLESVRGSSATRSHWVVKAPAGKRVEWDAEIVADEPGRFLAWRSLPGADVPNAGSVRFEALPGERGTLVRVDLQYSPPGSVAGAAVALLFNRAPNQQVHDDLRRLKQVLEAGEVIRSDGSPEGTGCIKQRPAQPLAA
ncbi:MAG TPA: SRPBCC family protein [Burkholderiales bacterium]|nr:SRPBCC family protein [Burkholderiales bacterium]